MTAFLVACPFIMAFGFYNGWTSAPRVFTYVSSGLGSLGILHICEMLFQ